MADGARSTALPTASQELQDVALGILRPLNAALKSAQLYSANHPSVEASIERLLASYRQAMADHLVVNLTFPGGTITINDAQILDLEPPFIRLSNHLHEIGIATLRFSSGADTQAFQHLLEVLATPRQEVLEVGNIEIFIDHQRLGTLRIVPLDYSRVFRVGADGLPSQRELIEPEGLWYAMITGYVVRRPEELDTEARDFIEAFAADPNKLRHLADELGKLQLDESWIDVSKVKGSLLANFYRSLGTVLQEQTVGRRDVLVQRIARGTEGLRPGQLLDALVGAGETSAGGGAGEEALFDQLIAAFNVDRAADLLSEAAQEVEAAELDRLVERMLTVHPEKKRILDLLDKQAMMVEGLQKGEMERAEALQALCRRFADADYLSVLAEPPKSAASDYIDQLRSLQEERAVAAELLQELLVDVAEREQANLHLALLECEDDPEQFEDQLTTLEELLRGAVESGSMDIALAIVQGTKRLAAEEGLLPPELAQQVGEFLRRLQVASLVAILVETYLNYAETPAERDVNKLIGEWGEEAVDLLLDFLKENEDRSQRRAIVTLLKNQGIGILPQVQARLHDRTWYFVRNLLHLLGEFHQEESARVLIPMLNHEDHRVVKEALAGLGRIGSKNATPFISRLLLTEPALSSKKHEEIRVVAARTLGMIGDPRAIDALRRGSHVRRHAVAKACAQTLREHGSTPRVR